MGGIIFNRLLGGVSYRWLWVTSSSAERGFVVLVASSDSEEFLEDAYLGGAGSDDVAACNDAEDLILVDNGEGLDGIGGHDLGGLVDGGVGVDGDEGVGHDVLGLYVGGVVAGLHDGLEDIALCDDACGSPAVDYNDGADAELVHLPDGVEGCVVGSHGLYVSGHDIPDYDESAHGITS